MLFDGWDSVLRIVMSAAITYVAVVVALRVVGARSLAKMSGYDLIVTVALGSVVAAIPLTSDISVTDGLAAIVTLLVLQEVIRRLQARSLKVHHLVRERPELVVWDGEFLPDRMSEMSISKDEVRAAIRRTGLASMSQVQAVVLENDGEWSVVPRSGEAKDLSAFEGLRIPYHLEPGEDPSHWRERNAPEPAGKANPAGQGVP